jgi:hypothetical protein
VDCHAANDGNGRDEDGERSEQHAKRPAKDAPEMVVIEVEGILKRQRSRE